MPKNPFGPDGIFGFAAREIGAPDDARQECMKAQYEAYAKSVAEERERIVANAMDALHDKPQWAWCDEGSKDIGRPMIAIATSANLQPSHTIRRNLLEEGSILGKGIIKDGRAEIEIVSDVAMLISQ